MQREVNRVNAVEIAVLTTSPPPELMLTWGTWLTDKIRLVVLSVGKFAPNKREGRSRIVASSLH